jgi:hypothetical protein
MKQADKIEQVVHALLCCPSLEDAARQCVVSRTTLWRLTREADFKQLLQEARANLSREIVFTLQANALDALNTLRCLMRDEQSSASTRVARPARSWTSPYVRGATNRGDQPRATLIAMPACLSDLSLNKDCKAMGIAPNRLGRCTLEGRMMMLMGGTM